MKDTMVAAEFFTIVTDQSINNFVYNKHNRKDEQNKQLAQAKSFKL